MTRSPGLSQWQHTVSTHLPHLSKPQVTALALWSFGMVLAQSCGLTSVTASIAPLVQRSEDAVRQQLREWCYDAEDKRGVKRQTLDVTTCFAPLLQWVLTWWAPTERRLALAMDASTLGQRFTVLSISVLYRGCAIPVAWVVVAATRKGAWKPHWLALFTALQDVVPSDWTVIVLADRGLDARWLYRHIQTLGWHPFLRINMGGKYRPHGCAQFRPLTLAVPTVGGSWSGRITCFATPESHLECTLLARWERGYTDPWLVVTDLPPETADIAWYGLRPWIESGYKDTKRGGWHWEQTKMRDPARATRMWLAIAVATLWVVSVGGQADATRSASMLDDVSPLLRTRCHATTRSRPRLLSCFRRGVIRIVTTLLTHGILPIGRFVPEPWPESIDMHEHETPVQFMAA
jgi:hypothetical protein